MCWTTCTCICVGLHVHAYVYICVCVCVCVHMCVSRIVYFGHIQSGWRTNHIDYLVNKYISLQHFHWNCILLGTTLPSAPFIRTFVTHTITRHALSYSNNTSQYLHGAPRKRQQGGAGPWRTTCNVLKQVSLSSSAAGGLRHHLGAMPVQESHHPCPRMTLLNHSGTRSTPSRGWWGNMEGGGEAVGTEQRRLTAMVDELAV